MKHRGLVASALMAACAMSAGTSEAEPRTDWLRWLDNEYYKLSLNVRPRVELARQDGRSSSQAWTVRSRLGIGSKPWHGLSAYAEGEGTFSFDSNAYRNLVSRDNGKTAVADPDYIELNQLFAKYSNPELFGAFAKGGRQRIVYDDARFIGNVGWRQNEQTFDAVRGSSSLGVEGLQAEYAFLWEIHRIFSDRGSKGTRDYNSRSHVARLHYRGLDFLDASLFAYFLDFRRTSAGNSSNSFGARLAGSHDLGEDWKLGYIGSFAYQIDAAKNPTDYYATYGWASGSVAYEPLAKLAVGYEYLGSDDGKARFVTPLATAHKFNGFADVFVNNGGDNGLQDLFAVVAPTLPWKLELKLIYHWFWSVERSRKLGEEFDAVLSRRFGKHWTLLAKSAVFQGTRAGPPDLWRFICEATFAF